MQTFHQNLKEKLDNYVDQAYQATKTFPKDETFGAVNQLKRAALSVALNYVEGYARRSHASDRHFLEISYGSLKESAYLAQFAFRHGWINRDAERSLTALGDEIGAMLWSTIIKKSKP